VKREINILCVEDVPADAVMLNHALRKGGFNFRLKRVETKDVFLRELDENPPDLILSDHGLPSFDGFTALSLARQKCPNVPFIFVTTALGEEKTIETFERGATDYVLKKDLSKLVPSVERALREADERTALKQKEQQLHESEERYRRLIEFCPDAFLVECDGELMFANITAARLLGAESAEELVGKSIKEFVDANYWEALQERLAGLHKNGTTFFWRSVERGNVQKPNEDGVAFPFVESRFVRLDGSAVDVDVAAAPLTLQQRQAVQIIVRNITDRKLAEEALQQSEERLRLLLENVKDYAIYMLDPQGKIVTWNPGAEKVEGFRAEEIIGKHFSAFFTPEDVASGVPREALKRAAREGRALNEGWRVRKDGSRFWSQGVITALYDEEGKIRGYSKIAHDMTKQKEIEESTHQLNDQLEERVLRRTAQLESANKELEAFSYSISHDLRAPLRHIAGYVEILQNEAAARLDDTSRQYLQTIAVATKTLGNLIDALLAFSRMGRAEMSQQRVNLASLVEEARLELRRDLEGRNIAWQFGPLPETQGDPVMLRQVIINLLSNALKFTRPRPQAKIEVSALDSENEIVFFVRDNGVGFDMNYADKLFGVFQRLHSANEFEGIGIGLANVRRIVHRHGGRTWAESKPEGGATFYFSIPKTPKEEI
jgi:PAS domain S-box-containing protein